MQWLLCLTEVYHIKFGNITPNYIFNIAKSNNLNEQYGIAGKAFKIHRIIILGTLKKRGENTDFANTQNNS